MGVEVKTLKPGDGKNIIFGYLNWMEEVSYLKLICFDPFFKKIILCRKDFPDEGKDGQRALRW